MAYKIVTDYTGWVYLTGGEIVHSSLGAHKFAWVTGDNSYSRFLWRAGPNGWVTAGRAESPAHAERVAKTWAYRRTYSA